MFGWQALSCRLYGRSAKLSRLQCTEERFSLVGSADMLIKVDFVNIGWPGMMANPTQTRPEVCRSAILPDSSLAVWYFVAFEGNCCPCVGNRPLQQIKRRSLGPNLQVNEFVI